MINPAYMTRQVHESALKEHGVIGHITSLDPLRPGNAPDSWEAEALRQFADGTTTEVSSIATLNGERYMRLMRPLYVEEGCLSCHGHQGYKVGEVRGGISVAVPISEKANAQYLTSFYLLAAYFLIWLAGSGGGFVAFRRLKAETLDRMLTGQQLHETVVKLEEKTQALDLALEQADAANHIKSNFLAMMSHEMRTPMTSIIGFSDVLRNSELSAEQQEYLQHVYEAAQNLSNIINTLLEFSKLDRGSIELRREQFSATSIIADTVPSRKAAAESKNLELTTAISPEMPQTVVGDKERIVKVVGNLLDNAIHHTSDGRVELRIEMVGNDPLMLKITVSDNGPGIPEELVSNLFDSFSQMEPVLTRAKGGIGLGLAICQRLVLLMGGTLNYEPNKPHGAVFWFTVPVE
jgi:signal transduction histidine kinase